MWSQLDAYSGRRWPGPVRRKEIQKPDGSMRMLGKPSVIDRVIQQAIAQVLTPIYEPLFSEHSWGFRPGRLLIGTVGGVGGGRVSLSPTRSAREAGRPFRAGKGRIRAQGIRKAERPGGGVQRAREIVRD